MVNILFVNQLRIKFSDTPAFTRAQLYEFFRELDPEVKETTIRLRIYNLKENGIIRAIEKILIDLYTGTKLFTLFQGGELEFIFSSVLEKYSVNETRMLNYAAIRGKKQDLALFIERLTTHSNG